MAKESNFKNMLFSLLLICFGGSAIMGGVYLLTYEPIAAAQEEKINNAIAQVLPSFDNKPAEESYEWEVSGKKVKIYPASVEGQFVGAAVEAVSSKGFGGPLKVMVGFLSDGTIFKTAIISHSETPGLGDKLDPRKSPFSNQFEGKNPATFPLSVKKDGGEVDAITAATISSRAFCDVLDIAYSAFMDAKEKGGNHE